MLKKHHIIPILLIIGNLTIIPTRSFGCTSLLVSKKASADSSVFITYSADSHTLYGSLTHLPATKNTKGTKRKIYHPDTKQYKGEIEEVEITYNVVGYMNEYQVAIGETTFDGRAELQDTTGILDYETLILLTLQRSQNAREAISTINSLVTQYGYCSTGESFSIADQNEVWIMELIGKGTREKGAVWVARKIPDGYVSAHANQSRIQQFPLNDPENCLYSDDVIKFARKSDYFSGKDEDFSFRDAYNPLTWEHQRWCEARVWNFFRQVAPKQIDEEDFANTNKEIKLPLWIKPDAPITLQALMKHMRNHFEDTQLDLSKGIGSGPFALPYRWRPLTWQVDSVKYCHDRAISTQQTAYSFVAQSRFWLPNAIGGILWFGFDDTYSTCYSPLFCSITQIPYSFSNQSGNFNSFSWESAFWVFNFVSNYAYGRYKDMIQDIKLKQSEIETGYITENDSITNNAIVLYNQNAKEGVAFLTDYSVNTGNKLTKTWKTLGEFLIWKYLDGNVRTNEGKVTHPGYEIEWKKAIIKENEVLYKMKKIE
ncbi:MAG: C69 family dipeptidase [Bacteroidales bacterium]|nr:C69 family dipeptidase [Bacteroidales bacterium]